MADLKKSQSAKKASLLKAYGNLGVFIAEDDYDAVVSQRDLLKTMYLEFQESHMEYHQMLDDEADIQISDVFFSEVQQVYIGHQNAAKLALKEMAQTKGQLNNEQSLKTLGHLINLPPLDLQKFSGKPEEYDNFIATFQEVIGNAVSDPAAKLVRLKSQLTGTALDSIKMCRTDSENGYTQAINILRERFGSPYIVCNSVIESLKYGPDVRCPADIRTFSDELLNAEVVLKNNNMFTEIDTQHNIIEICLRLESYLRYEWRSKVMKNKQSTGAYLRFSDFVTFVREHADVVNDPLYGKDALEGRPNRTMNKKSVSSLLARSVDNLTASPQTNSELYPSVRCHLCSKSHKLYTCFKFRNMPVDKRCDYVKNNNLCVLCLSKDHSVVDCRSTYVCKINNCGEKHSSSLHVYPNVQLPSLTSSVRSNDNPNVHMPTVPVVIDGTFHTDALLDTGSSTTFCSKRLVDELKLQDTKMSYKLRTLHGSQDSLSEVVNFQVSSKDGTKCLYMENVLVVDDIPVENCSINEVGSYPHLKDLTFSHESQVDLLIGQDNSAALVPLDVRCGPVGTPFATLTLMGWTLSGCAPMNVPSRLVTSCLISATIQNAREHRHKESKHVALHKETLEMSAGDITFNMSDILYVTINRIVVLLCLMWLFLYSIMWLSIYYSYYFILYWFLYLKHFMLQWGECYV